MSETVSDPLTETEGLELELALTRVAHARTTLALAEERLVALRTRICAAHAREGYAAADLTTSAITLRRHDRG